MVWVLLPGVELTSRDITARLRFYLNSGSLKDVSEPPRVRILMDNQSLHSRFRLRLPKRWFDHGSMYFRGENAILSSQIVHPCVVMNRTWIFRSSIPSNGDPGS